MRVEKTSKYITVNEQRRVLLSLPRVKWLEAQPDYEPWPPLVEAPKPVADYQPARYDSRPQKRSHELTARQKQAWDYHTEGKTNKEIALIMGSTNNAVGKLLEQAREKLGVGLK